MTAIRKATILKMAAAAYEMDLDVVSGILGRDEEGRRKIGHQDLEKWLARHEGEEIVLIMGSLAEDKTIETRTCHTCGRDYTDIECPYCRSSRIRLRGEP